MKAAHLNSFFTDLKIILPLANAHMVHFVTHKMFQNILSAAIQKEINALSLSELNILFLRNFTEFNFNDKAPHLSELLQKVHKLYLKENESCSSLAKLCEDLRLRESNDSNPLITNNLMSLKKSHEVEMLSGIVATLVKSEKCSHVVDVGGGKGYLSSVLALKHQIKVLSIDSSHVTSKGAAKRIPKVEKYWNISQRKSANRDVTEESLLNSEGSNKTGLEEKSPDRLKLATMFIADDTNVSQLVNDNFPDDYVEGIILVGLHTCGNLAASSLRLFMHNAKDIRCVINVGCCYHLLVEEFDTNPPWLEVQQQASGVGFPMSAYLRDQKFVLGRNARMLASQSPDRISHEGKLETEVLLYRALLESYLEKKLGQLGLPHFKVGKIGKKCSNFHDYVHKSVNRLGLDIVMDDEELKQLYDSHSETKKQLHAFFLLRLTIAPAIEAAIMLDRLLYLQEQGLENAYLTQLFDPVVSPRCFAIIAFNQTENSNSSDQKKTKYPISS